MTILIDAEKAFDKTKYSFHDKNKTKTQQTRNRKELHQPDKTYENPQISLLKYMTESFPIRPRTNKGYSSTLITAVQHYSGGSNRPIGQEKISRLERRKQNYLYAQMT